MKTNVSVVSDNDKKKLETIINSCNNRIVY